MKFDGYICMEIGYNQKEEVLELIKQNNQYTDTYSKKDLHGNDRIIVTRVRG